MFVFHLPATFLAQSGPQRGQPDFGHLGKELYISGNLVLGHLLVAAVDGIVAKQADGNRHLAGTDNQRSLMENQLENKK